MRETARRRLLEYLDDDEVVLDVGGWADPLERADWVLDLMPYETRGMYARRGWAPPRAETERFTPDTWIERDICSREPYPFEDGEIDFVVCSHTLEDIRDPVWVCSEISRIAKAGYVEVPSQLEELSWGVFGNPGVGWSHHRWLVDTRPGGLDFVAKPYGLHARSDLHLPPGVWEMLSEEERVTDLWWEDRIDARERIFLEEAELERYLGDLVRQALFSKGLPPGRAARLQRLRQRAGRRLMRD